MSMPNGTRRAHSRNGHPVRAASIKGRKAPQKRLTATARRRAQSKPLLLAAGTLAGLGALDAILTGRWGGALVLGLGALSFVVGHAAWSRHKNRQARPAKPKPAKKAAAVEQRREALAKAREAHQPKTAPAELPRSPRAAPRTSNGTAPTKAPAPEPGPWQAPPATNGGAMTHAESVAQNGHRCDCANCKAERRAASAAFWAKKKPVKR